MAELSVFGVGVATADPELRYVGQNKTALCTVNLAFNRSFRDKEQNWQTEACFLRAQVWGNRAEKMAELVKKGQPIYVSGYMKQDSWENDDGQKRVSYSLSVRDFQLCAKNGKNKDEAKKTNKAETSEPPPMENDESIPF
jgi:single-strand DNA-binding protein